MTRKFTLMFLAALLLLSPLAVTADDTTSVTPASAVTTPAAAVAAPADAAVPAVATPKTDDPVADAGKKIDDATEDINENPAANIEAIISAFKEGRWAAGIGLVVMFLIWGLRRFLWKLIPKSALPYVTLALGCAVTVSIELISGIVWWKTLIDGFLASASAMALWSLVFKHVLSSKDDEPAS